MEENFEELLNQSMKEQKLGKTVTGKVLRITKQNEIFIDIGYKADGIIPYSEYTKEEGKDPREELKIGEEITADVLKMNDGLGNVLLSYRRAKDRMVQKEFEEKVKKQEVFQEIVLQVNPNGLITTYKGIRIFIPMSLSGISRNEKAEDYQGKQVKFVITEYDKQNRKVIGSIKELKDQQIQQIQKEFWKKVKIGDSLPGIVRSLSSYGAFVEVEEGIQGLLHVSDMSWERNCKPEDLIQVGETIQVMIKEFDPEHRRIKLALETKGEDPWEQVQNAYHVGDIIKVKIVKLINFGAFAQIKPGVEGLIHLSQMTGEKITKPEEKLEIGQECNVKILNIDLENRKIELSIRELEGTSYDPNYREELKKYQVSKIEGEENE